MFDSNNWVRVYSVLLTEGVCLWEEEKSFNML